MALNPRFSLRLSLSGSIVGAVLLTSLLLGSVTFTMWRQSLREGLQEQLRSLAATSALMVDPAVHHRLQAPGDMQGEDYQALRARLKLIKDLNPDIKYLYSFRWLPGEDKPRFILDTGTPGLDFSPLGTPYDSATATLRQAFAPPYAVRVGPDIYTDEYGTWLSAFAPILNPDGSLEGVLGMDMDAAMVLEREFRLLALVGGLTLLVVILMGVLSLWFAQRIARPLAALSRDMGRIQEFQLDGALEAESRISEVRTMTQALQNMKLGLRSFRKFVPADLVSDLIVLRQEAVLGTEKRELTVFFCDLANFTAASEKLSPETLNQLLSSYFETVTRTLQAHGATVDKFIGDAVMAFWNAPRTMGDHAQAGARAALEVQARLSALLTQWEEEGLPSLATRIGLNTGVVLVGNVGQSERLSYTALGDAVNLASRLEGLNKFYGTGVLAGEDTLNQLGRSVLWRPVDRVAVAGKTQGCLIGELASQAPEWWHDYRQAWERYEAADWAGAAEGFAGLAQSPLNDGPSRVLAERCRRFASEGLPPDWQGVWVMHSK